MAAGKRDDGHSGRRGRWCSWQYGCRQQRVRRGYHKFGPDRRGANQRGARCDSRKRCGWLSEFGDARHERI